MRAKVASLQSDAEKKTTYEEYERPTTVLLPDESLKKLE